MADSLSWVQKLISLALNNPNEEEARSAAMKAVSLIVAENMTIGGANTGQDPTRVRKTWAPDAEFDAFWEQMAADSKKGFVSQDDVDRNPWDPQPSSGEQGLKTAHVDTDVEDAFSAMRTRIKLAWRAIQRERARLKTEIYNAETKYSFRYPRQEPKEWEALCTYCGSTTMVNDRIAHTPECQRP